MSVRNILVVDDSASFRRQLRQILEDAEFTVLEAEDGARGVTLASDNGVALMLVDVNMPIMGGIEMIRKVRALPEHQTTPIFVLTTESGTADAKQAKAIGATAWIVKPVKPEVLIKAIEKVLRR